MPYEKYIKKILKSGADKAVVINPKNVVTGQWVRLKCQYGCNGYGKKHTCPPNSPTPDVTRKMLAEYKKAILIIYSGKWRGTDKKSWARERAMRRQMRRKIVKIEMSIFLDGYYKAFALGAGPCNFCSTCNITKPCKYPDLARPAMEACGIDVFKTLRKHGIKIDVVKTYHSPCTFASLILIE